MEPQELEALVESLVAQFGHCKVNLLRPGEGNEGIWAVAVDKVSSDRVKDDNSTGEEVRLRLCNQPLGWGGKSWGDEIIAITRGDRRPEASLGMQIELTVGA